MTTLDKVKIIIAGDSGVGKSSLVHLISHGEPVSNPSWTIGCSVDVKVHEYKEGTPLQKTFFVELWDVGGSSSHASSRNVLYTSVNGVILVHDLTNRKSEQNLRKWLAEILSKEGNKGKSTSYEYDAEQYVDSFIPITVIGTKQDLAHEVRLNKTSLNSSVAEECGADEILLDCHQVKSLAPGSSNAVKLSRFFDKVIERKYYSREENQSAVLLSTKNHKRTRNIIIFYQSFLDKRRYVTTTKVFHSD